MLGGGVPQRDRLRGYKDADAESRSRPGRHAFESVEDDGGQDRRASIERQARNSAPALQRAAVQLPRLSGKSRQADKHGASEEDTEDSAAVFGIVTTEVLAEPRLRIPSALRAFGLLRGALPKKWAAPRRRRLLLPLASSSVDVVQSLLVKRGKEHEHFGMKAYDEIWGVFGL